MQQTIIDIRQGIPRMPEWRMNEPVDFALSDGEHIAIVGPNGGGKSMLVDILTGKHPLLGNGPIYDFRPSKKSLVSDNIKYITFRDTYGDGNSTYFMQQRWNQQEIDESMPPVSKLLEEAYMLADTDSTERRQLQKHLYDLFSISHLSDKNVVMLSSGEMRKFQITKALLSNPRVMIMDNPFIGLDSETRDQLKDLLDSLSKEHALQIVLVLSKTDDIPTFITHVIEVSKMHVHPKVPKDEYLSIHSNPHAKHVLDSIKAAAIAELPYKDCKYRTDRVVQMNDVTISYGNRIILNKLNWTVKNGERWALNGKNGSGKSTLLSLICADNPQSYACDIELFGHPRGSGESIWDIKKHIGYVSPEMHRAYLRDLPAIHIVASGLKDSVGLYVKPAQSEYSICRLWMNIFGLEGMESTSFLKMSSGEQRLVLLARAFVKDPELLILDEPLHGLDDTNRCMVKDIINLFCQRRNKTMIMVTHYDEELPECISHRLSLTRHI